MKVKKIPFEEFKSIYSRVPRLCVEVVILQEKKLLLIKRTIPPALGKWHTPGGTILKGENIARAVERVAKEELGISVRILQFLGIIEYTSYVNHYSQDISLAFLVEIKRTVHTTQFNLDVHADEYNFFKEIPLNTIVEQKKFYSKNLGLAVSKK